MFSMPREWPGMIHYIHTLEYKVATTAKIDGNVISVSRRAGPKGGRV